MRILAVGERFNQRAWAPHDVLLNHSFDLRVQMGIYNHGPRRRFLKDRGVRWHDGINLLWPSPTPGDWNAYEAKRVVESILDRVQNYDRVLLFGRRVCEAFNVQYEVGKIFNEIFIPLPHPNGRSQLWKDPKIQRFIRAACDV